VGWGLQAVPDGWDVILLSLGAVKGDRVLLDSSWIERGLITSCVSVLADKFLFDAATARFGIATAT